MRLFGAGLEEIGWAVRVRARVLTNREFWWNIRASVRSHWDTFIKLGGLDAW